MLRELSLARRLSGRCITLSAIINFPHYRNIIQVLPRAAFQPDGGPVAAIRSPWARTYSRGPPLLPTEKRPGRPGRAGNAVIFERVKKCDRIKAPFASGGPLRRRPTLLVVATARTGTMRRRWGPGVIGSAYL